MPLQHYTGEALLQIGLIVKVRIVKTNFTPDSGKFLSAKFPAIRYMEVGMFAIYRLPRNTIFPKNIIPKVHTQIFYLSDFPIYKKTIKKTTEQTFYMLLWVGVILCVAQLI